jgi:proline iminopeptidase
MADRTTYIPWDQYLPDREQVIKIGTHNVIAYDFGVSNDAVLALNGGPGLPCDYLRDSHSFLKEFGYRFIAFDQLGTGKSDKPQDDALWTIQRYAQEVETVRSQLSLEKVHLLGQSWGGWLAVEYACSYPQNLKSLILEDTCADIPLLITELERLRGSLGPETVAMMKAHEAAGSTDHPEYLAAITLLDYRHVCRLKERPAPLIRSLNNMNKHIYTFMQGPNEFLYVGNLRNWSRIADVHQVQCPVLIIVGQHDEITPTCAIQMKYSFMNARVRVFNNSSHSPFYEEPDKFQSELVAFLNEVSGR